jgi:hypothetical protein
VVVDYEGVRLRLFNDTIPTALAAQRRVVMGDETERI